MEGDMEGDTEMREIWYIRNYGSEWVEVWLFSDNDKIDEFDCNIFVRKEDLFYVLNYLDCKYNGDGIVPVFEMG